MLLSLDYAIRFAAKKAGKDLNALQNWAAPMGMVSGNGAAVSQCNPNEQWLERLVIQTRGPHLGVWHRQQQGVQGDEALLLWGRRWRVCKDGTELPMADLAGPVPLLVDPPLYTRLVRVLHAQGRGRQLCACLSPIAVIKYRGPFIRLTGTWVGVGIGYRTRVTAGGDLSLCTSSDYGNVAGSAHEQ